MHSRPGSEALRDCCKLLASQILVCTLLTTVIRRPAQDGVQHAWEGSEEALTSLSGHTCLT